MSILKSTHSGQRMYWHKQIEDIARTIDTILEDSKTTDRDSVFLFYDMPCGYSDIKKKKVAYSRCRIEFWKRQPDTTLNTIKVAFFNATENSTYNEPKFYMEDIPISTIEIKFEKAQF